MSDIIIANNNKTVKEDRRLTALTSCDTFNENDSYSGAPSSFDGGDVETGVAATSAFVAAAVRNSTSKQHEDDTKRRKRYIGWFIIATASLLIVVGLIARLSSSSSSNAAPPSIEDEDIDIDADSNFDFQDQYAPTIIIGDGAVVGEDDSSTPSTDNDGIITLWNAEDISSSNDVSSDADPDIATSIANEEDEDTAAAAAIIVGEEDEEKSEDENNNLVLEVTVEEIDTDISAVTASSPTTTQATTTTSSPTTMTPTTSSPSALPTMVTNKVSLYHIFMSIVHVCIHFISLNHFFPLLIYLLNRNKNTSQPTNKPFALDVSSWNVMAPTPPPTPKPVFDMSSWDESLIVTTPPPTTSSPTAYPITTSSPTLSPITSAPTNAPTNKSNPYFFGEQFITVPSLGIEMSAGLNVKLIAKTGTRVQYANGDTSNDSWHTNSDAAGIIPLDADNPTEGGYVYMSNSESDKGGVYGLYFDKHGNIQDYKALLTGTVDNCGGGLTPWATWVSCEEEYDVGQCWQVGPDGRAEETVLGGDGGNFESIAVDARVYDAPVIFTTEDADDGALRRFVATQHGWDALHTDGYETYLNLFNDGTFEWTEDLNVGRTSAKKFYPNSVSYVLLGY